MFQCIVCLKTLLNKRNILFRQEGPEEFVALCPSGDCMILFDLEDTIEQRFLRANRLRGYEKIAHEILESLGVPKQSWGKKLEDSSRKRRKKEIKIIRRHNA